ncbi:MAG: SPW repeat protein, partial [Haloarculaceae archaeon]
IRTSIEEWAGTPVEWGSWIAALAGLWLLVSPFVLSGEIASGAPMYSNVIAGLLVLALGAYAGWTFRSA